MSFVIVYHDNCPDGYGAMWWLRRIIQRSYAQADELCDRLGIQPSIAEVPARYGDEPNLDLMAGRVVYIVDFCYEAEQLDAIAAVAQRLCVFDHHDTAAGHLERSRLVVFDTVADAATADPPSHYAVLDMAQSGIGIVGEFCGLFDGEPLPPWLLCIEDRDLWKFEMGDLTREVFATVTSRPYTLEAWGEMHRMGLEALRDEGRAINRYRNQLVDQVAASSFVILLDGGPDPRWVVPCASSPYAIGSDVAGRLAENSPEGVGAYVILHADHVQVGLRARRNGPNVARIAERYGGGGHPGASGLKLTWEQFEAARQ